VSRQVRVACEHYYTQAADSEPCDACGKYRSDHPTTYGATLADPRIEALIALGEAYAKVEEVAYSCDGSTMGDADQEWGAVNDALEAALAALRALEKKT